MNRSRLFILLVCGFGVPLFVSGQTMSTSTAVQEPDFAQQRAAVQSQIDQMTQDFVNSFPTQAELTTQAIKNNLNVKIEPKNPGPNDKVVVTLVGYLTDLDRAIVEWIVNGRVISSGVGAKVFSFQLGQSLQTTSVVVRITTANGENISKEFSFTPLGATILWEADTYTPPFYKGKPLLSAEARVRAIAIPEIESAQNSLGAGNLVYTWEKNMITRTDSSGYRKNSFSFNAPDPYDRAKVSVTVSSLDGSLGTKKYVDIPATTPFILFYENHPLLGLWQNNVLGPELSLTKKELSISAEPFFFSNEQDGVSTIDYSWTMNGSSIRNPGRTITLRGQTDKKGDSVVALTMRGLVQTFQAASQSLSIHFTNPEQTNSLF